MDELPSAKWISELEFEDTPSFFHQYQVDDYSLDDLNFQQSFSSESYSSYPNFVPEKPQNLSNTPLQDPQTDFERPAKQLKTNSWNSCTTTNYDHMSANASPCSSSQIISFEKYPNSVSATPENRHYNYLDSTINKPKGEFRLNGYNMVLESSYEAQNCQVVKRPLGTMNRSPLQAQDRIIAERKRREKLSQRLIALAAAVPGLKMTDKASVLGEAIKYIKNLQERVNTLEEQATKKTVESVVFVKRSQLSADTAETSLSDENFDSNADRPLPEIEARVLDKDVLITIQCEKHKGCLANILNEIKKLHLTVVNSTVFPFGTSTNHITIVAQMQVKHNMKVQDLVRNLLRQTLLKS